MRLSLVGLGVAFPLLCLALAGCGQQPAIRTYTITLDPTPKKVASAEDKPGLMLGGILLSENKAWFFKATGPLEEMATQKEAFREFLKSVRVEAGAAAPTWKLPEGWEVDERPRQMRIATILVPLASKPVELAISSLDRQPGDDQGYLLININRWRDQMKLDHLAAKDLQSLPEIEAGDKSIVLVELEGTLPAAGGGMGGPFSGS